MLPSMYGLRKEIDLSFLTGRELIQVAIGSFQIQFHFDEDVTVSVEAEFCYFEGQDEWIWQRKPCSRQSAARTAALLGARITTFETKASGPLALTFSSAHRLALFDSFKQYDSYDITRPAQPI